MKINNIAELKTRRGTFNANVEVLGYYSSGDGGGGGFYWDNSSVETDNGGTVIQVTGVSTGRWKRVFNDSVNVKWFGAKGDYDGTTGTNDTNAINAATQSTKIHTGNNTDLSYGVIFPSGNYLIQGTVYIRKGQHLWGDGNGASRIIIPNDTNKNTFVLGKGLINEVETSDAGGLPIQVSNIGFEGGTGTALCFDNIQGFNLSKCFFTGCGKALEIKNGSADGVISDCIFDINLNSIIINGSQNLIFSNIIEYNSNYGVTFQDICNDIEFNNYHSEYIKYAGVLFADNSINKNISFNNTNFLLNTQYSTFSGFFYDRSNYSNYLISNSNFRNMKNYAIKIETPETHILNLSNCTFDGEKTNSLYTQSVTSAGIDVLNSDVSIFNCNFKNLSGYILNISSSLFENLIWDGGKIENITTNNSINISSNGNGKIELKNINGGGVLLYNSQEYVDVITSNLTNWLKKVDDGTNIYWLIPFRFSKLYNFELSANIASGGNADYRKTIKYFISTQNGYDGTTPTTYIEYQLIFKNSITNFIGDILVTFKFGSTTGSTSVNMINNGYICAYIPNTYTNLTLDVN